MSYTLPDKPRSVGDLVGLAFRLFRFNWKLILQKLVTPSIFMSVSISALEWCFVNWRSAQSLEVSWFVIHMSIALILLIILIASQWEIALRSCALVRLYLEEESDFDESYEFARSRQLAILSVYGISFLLPFLVCVLWILFAVGTVALIRLGPIFKYLSILLGFIEAISFLFAFSFSMVYTGMCFVSVSQKLRSVKDALVEGYKISAANLPRGLGFVCLLACSVYIFSFIFYLPTAILAMLEGLAQGSTPDAQYPIYIRVLDSITGTLVNVLSVGIGLAGLCFYYRDLKIRVYGDDIERAIDFRQRRDIEK